MVLTPATEVRLQLAAALIFVLGLTLGCGPRSAAAPTVATSPTPFPSPSPSPALQAPTAKPLAFHLTFTGAINLDWIRSFGRICGPGGGPRYRVDQIFLEVGWHYSGNADLAVDVLLHANDFPGVDLKSGGAIVVKPVRPSPAAPFGQQVEIDSLGKIVDRYIGQTGRIDVAPPLPGLISGTRTTLHGDLDVMYTDPSRRTVRVFGNWDCVYTVP